MGVCSPVSQESGSFYYHVHLQGQVVLQGGYTYNTGIFITASQFRKRVKIGVLLNQSECLLIDKNKIFSQFSKMPFIFNG